MSRSPGRAALPGNGTLPAAWGNSWPDQSKKVRKLCKPDFKNSKNTGIWELWFESILLTPAQEPLVLPKSRDQRATRATEGPALPQSLPRTLVHATLGFSEAPCLPSQGTILSVVVRKWPLAMGKAKLGWAPEQQASFAKAALGRQQGPWAGGSQLALSQQPQFAHPKPCIRGGRWCVRPCQVDRCYVLSSVTSLFPKSTGQGATPHT